MDLLQPLLVQRIIDDGVARGDADAVLWTALTMLGVMLIGLVGGMACTVFAILAGQGFGSDLRHALFTHVQQLAPGNLDRLETGGLITRLTNDVVQMQELVMVMLRIMVRVPLLLVGSVIMAAITSPQLALIFFVVIPLVAMVLFVVLRTTLPLFGRVQQQLDRLNSVLQENLAGVRVVRAFARAEHKLLRFGGVNETLMVTTTRATRAGAITLPLVLLLLNGGVVAALWWGGGYVARARCRLASWWRLSTT